MDLLIKNATVVTGDGTMVMKQASVWVDKGLIQGVEQGTDKVPAEAVVAKTIDARGFYVIPGTINNHAHGCALGPLFPSGTNPLSLDRALRNADRFMLQGTTTLVNVCGLHTVADVEEVNSRHPMNIKAGTGHVPSNIRAAQIVDGAGLKGEHLSTTPEAMLEAGAVLIGEMAGGPTLGGGVQDYMLLPNAFLAETGVEVDAPLAKGIKVAAIGRYMRPEEYRVENMEAALRKAGLEGKVSPERARDIIYEIALPPVTSALQGFDEASEVSARTGVPAVFHNSAVSAQRLIALGKKYQGTPAVLVAGHSNHNMFDIEECVKVAREMRDLGVVIDVSTLDGVVTLWRNFPERLEALVSEGLVDTLSTDYGAGHWDGVLECIHFLVKRGRCSLPQGVAMATGNVAKIFHRAAPNRGFLAPGKVADIVIADDKNIGRVEAVIIGGRVVANCSWLTYAS